MKELIKPTKKREVFERLDVTAFHEKFGQYSEGGRYVQGSNPRQDDYVESNNLLGEDILF